MACKYTYIYIFIFQMQSLRVVFFPEEDRSERKAGRASVTTVTLLPSAVHSLAYAAWVSIGSWQQNGRGDVCLAQRARSIRYFGAEVAPSH